MSDRGNYMELTAQRLATTVQPLYFMQSTVDPPGRIGRKPVFWMPRLVLAADESFLTLAKRHRSRCCIIVLQVHGVMVMINDITGQGSVSISSYVRRSG